MKYINKSDQVPAGGRLEETSFDKTGSEVINKKEKSCAKIVRMTNRSENRQKYHIKTYQSSLYVPWGIHSHREEYIETKFQEVSKDTFDFYMLFLKTRNSLYMTRAQRSFTDD